VKGESLVISSNSPPPLGPTTTNLKLVYQPEGLRKAQEIKQQLDDVLDNLKGMVTHVTQREEMKIRQHTNP
jgi:hypothetical protein